MIHRIAVLTCLILGAGCTYEIKPSPPASAAGTAQPSSGDQAGSGKIVEAVPAPMELVPAKVGVGSKGRSLDEHEGMIVTPAKALFATKERVVFEIAVPHALALYKAEIGNAPRSHDEFMQKIIEANQIKLPQLPAGHSYKFDPETEQLMVERPAKAATAKP